MVHRYVGTSQKNAICFYMHAPYKDGTGKLANAQFKQQTQLKYKPTNQSPVHGCPRARCNHTTLMLACWSKETP